MTKLLRANINKENKRKTSKKRILFVEQNQDGTIGGSHHSLLYLIRSLNKEKYNSLVMFYEENNDIIERFTANNIRVLIYKKPLGKDIRPPYKILRAPYLLIRKCYNFIRISCIPIIRFAICIIENKIDMIHLNNTVHAGYEWLLVAKIFRRKCITHQRGFANFKWSSKKSAQYFDKIICISKAVQGSLESNNIFNTILIYNAIDVNEFKSRNTKYPKYIKEEFGINNSVPLIGMIGNFQEWKGHLTLINAIYILSQHYPKVVCLLIGAVSTGKSDREYFTKVNKEIQAKGLGKNLIITGYRSDIPDLINSLDVMIHTSIFPEPFGRVLLEGMCLKKPVIATAIGGPKEIIKNGISGILVPPGKPKVLAEKIEYLLEHPELRRDIGRNAHARILDKFSLKQYSHEINALYDDLFAL